MTSDVLLIVNDFKLRAKIKNILETKSRDFRFLDEAYFGNIGLEKAFLLNPDIIIIDVWSGVFDGFYIAKKLFEKKYNCKIILLDTQDKTPHIKISENVCGAMAKEAIDDDKQLIKLLEKVSKMNISSAENISITLYDDILQCDVATDLAVIKDKYDLNLDLKHSFHMITCKVLSPHFSSVEFISKHLAEMKAIFEKYRDGIVFSSQGLIFFILNFCEDIQLLQQNLYQYLKKATGLDIYFFTFNDAHSLEEMKAKLKNAQEYTRHLFFRVRSDMLDENFLKLNKSTLPKAMLDSYIKQIQFDIREKDELQLLRDIDDLFLQKIKLSMDFHGFSYTFNRLIQIYNDMAILESLDTISPLENEYYIEKAVKYLKRQYIFLFRELYPAIIGNPIVQDAIWYIRQHFADDINLNVVAHHVNVSSPYLSAILKKALGINFTEYLLELRLNRAKELLKNHQMKIYEVADECGFIQAKYFSKVFKKYVGVTPKEYRKDQQDSLEMEIKSESSLLY